MTIMTYYLESNPGSMIWCRFWRLSPSSMAISWSIRHLTFVKKRCHTPFFKKTQLFVSHLKETQLFFHISFFLFIFFSFEKTQLLFTQIIFFICLVVCPDVHPVVHPVICPVIHPVICPVVRLVVHPVIHPLPCHLPGYSYSYLMFTNLTNHFIKLSYGDLQCEWNSDIFSLNMILSI